MKPLALISLKVTAFTGGLFQDPSSGVASRVFPKFHPGLNAAKAADAETGVKVPVQFWEIVRGAKECTPPITQKTTERNLDMRIVTK